MGDNMVRRRNYSTIKDLVFEIIHQTKGKVDYETMTKYILEQFPQSKWKATHWSWYKSQIKTGEFKDDFSAEEKKNLKLNKAEKILLNLLPPDKQEENHVKRIGDNILNHIRMMIREISKDNEDFEFKLNRWVYARLQQDEIKKKRPIKQELWDFGTQSCRGCDKAFQTLKGVEIHRKDASKAYSINNCELLCRPCHQKQP